MSRPSRPNLANGGGITRRLFVCGLGLAPCPAFGKPWSDPSTGLAISGYDAVSYYEDKGPLRGREDFEVEYDSAYWRFHNEGNKAAFLKHPALYAPQFGGHDPVLMLDMYLTQGHPLLWRIVSDRLYLFFADKQREAFDANPVQFIRGAARNWETLRKGLY